MSNNRWSVGSQDLYSVMVALMSPLDSPTCFLSFTSIVYEWRSSWSFLVCTRCPSLDVVEMDTRAARADQHLTSVSLLRISLSFSSISSLFLSIWRSPAGRNGNKEWLSGTLVPSLPTRKTIAFQLLLTLFRFLLNSVGRLTFDTNLVVVYYTLSKLLKKYVTPRSPIIVQCP